MFFEKKKLGEQCSFNVKCAFSKKALKLLRNQRMGKNIINVSILIIIIIFYRTTNLNCSSKDATTCLFLVNS
jgi:hypothetical protein